ncbi:hypothetical protein E2C01_015668 [Portunus trituberculatus]|uniref:Uncharacterized protein n=1 Tax=Portunus trituberculatus TaxID=210409 RepID=A0A5B7DMI6_PORTR|nr:hypothetical protein [Portunus trituberculatus]
MEQLVVRSGWRYHSIRARDKGQEEFHEQLPASAHGGRPALVVREVRGVVVGGLAGLRGGGGVTVA